MGLMLTGMTSKEQNRDPDCRTEAEWISTEVSRLEHVVRKVWICPVEITATAGNTHSTGHLKKRCPFIASLESQ